MSNKEKVEALQAWLKERDTRWEDLHVMWEAHPVVARQRILEHFLAGRPICVERRTNLGAIGVGQMTLLRALPR